MADYVALGVGRAGADWLHKTLEKYKDIVPKIEEETKKLQSRYDEIKRKERDYKAKNETFFKKIVETSFKERRKTLLNNLSSIYGKDKTKDIAISFALILANLTKIILIKENIHPTVSNYSLGYFYMSVLVT